MTSSWFLIPQLGRCLRSDRGRCFGSELGRYFRSELLRRFGPELSRCFSSELGRLFGSGVGKFLGLELGRRSSSELGGRSRPVRCIAQFSRPPQSSSTTARFNLVPSVVVCNLNLLRPTHSDFRGCGQL